MKKSKINLVVIGPYPRDPSRIERGVEAVTVYLVEGLKNISDLNVQIISFRGGVDQEDTCMLDGVKVHFLPAVHRFGNITFGALERFRVRRKIRQLNVDLIHNEYHFAFPYIGSEPPCPALTTVHGIIYKEVIFNKTPLDWIRTPARLYLERIVLRKVRHAICVTDYVKESISGLTNARLYVVANPVSDAYFGLENKEVTNRVLFAGTIIKRKNLLDLLKAINYIKDGMAGLRLNIVGVAEDKSYYETLRNYIKGNALEKHVAFLGPLDEKDLLNEYEQASVIVLPSLEESAGMVLQQAMAAGKPVVATRVGGIPCIVEDDKTGFLVEIGNTEDMGEKIRLLLQNTDLRQKFGQYGKRQATQRFSARGVANETYAVYRHILGHLS